MTQNLFLQILLEWLHRNQPLTVETFFRDHVIKWIEQGWVRRDALRFISKIVNPDVLPAEVFRPTSGIAEQSSAGIFMGAGSSRTQYLDRKGKA